MMAKLQIVINKKTWFAICLIIVTLIFYFQVRDFEFITFDDPAYVYDNENITKGITLDSLYWIFTNKVVGNWHPITMLTHLIDVEIYGINPGGHHITNVLIHILNVIMLYGFIARAANNIGLALFVALIFAIHPSRIESVVWVSERKDVLSTFFMLISLHWYLFWVDKQNKKGYIIAIVFFIFALMSKPMVITYPFVLMLFDFWPLNRIQKNKIKKLIIEKIPFIIATIIFAYITLLSQDSGINIKTPIDVKVLNSFYAYLKYIVMYVVPLDNSIIYPYKSASLMEGALSLIVILILTYYSIINIKKKKWFFVGWFLFLGYMVPVIGVVQIGVHSVADRYTYFSFIGLSILFYMSCLSWKNEGKVSKGILVFMSAIFLINITIQHFNYIKYWRDSFLLFTKVLVKYDEGYIKAMLHNDNQKRDVYTAIGAAYKLVGGRYINAAMFDEGLKVLEMGLSVGGDRDYQVHKFLSIGYLSTDKIEKAECHYYKAVQLYNDKEFVFKVDEADVFNLLKKEIDNRILEIN